MTHTSPHYGYAWAALVLLAGASYGAAHVSLATWAMPVALAIAAIKVAVVLTRFMHVQRDHGIGGWALVTAGAFVVIMVSLVLLEVAWRAEP